MVPVYALLAFGGQLEVLHDQGLLLLDGWAKFKAPARVSLGLGMFFFTLFGRGKGGGSHVRFAASIFLSVAVVLACHAASVPLRVSVATVASSFPLPGSAA
jgi:hypothetical protein